MRCRAFLLPVTLLQGIIASDVDMDPLSNLRPNNITGLVYSLYRWTGSYYNGTTTIRIQPREYSKGKECTSRAPGPIVVSYNNSLLAVTQTNGHLIQENHDAANPFAFSLKFWNSGLNIAPSGIVNNSPIKDVQEIDSVQMNTKDKPDDATVAPPWNLTAFHKAALTYTFTGSRNSTTSPQPLRFNYSQCTSHSLSLFTGTILGAQSALSSNSSTPSAPSVNGTFSNSSAWLEMKGSFEGRSVDGSLLRGNVTISFNGTVDEVRSDRLAPNTHGSTPIWQSTLGYEKDLTGERPLVLLGLGNKMGAGWGWVLGVLGMMVMFGV